MKRCGGFAMRKLSERVIFNVSGTRFETRPETLDRFPNTLLGNVEKRSQYYNNCRHEHFLNRNSGAFDAILYYYQSNGSLIRPPHIPVELFADEIRFYELGEACVKSLQNADDEEEEEDEVLPEGEYQRRIWQLFEHPETSFGARIVAVISISVIIISIAAFCIETLPVDQKEIVKNVSGHKMPWFAIETGCIIWFTFEYIMRLISTPRKVYFIRSFLNVIDVIAILPFYITLPLPVTTVSSFGVLRVLRLVRVFRIFKLSRHSRGLQIVGLTLKSSFRELLLLVFFVFVGVILFSSAMFFAGGDRSLAGERGDHLSIPHIFWWSIITMTTVGYGDVWPDTAAGKVIGTVCAISGVLTIALPVPVIVSTFEYYYNKELSRQMNEDNEKKDNEGEEEEWSSKNFTKEVYDDAIELPVIEFRSPMSTSSLVKGEAREEKGGSMPFFGCK